MGYCGVPSRACSNCRARRIKCNLSHPCSQCLRAGRPCDGSRPILDLMFRDQSKEVASKVQGTKLKTKPKAKPKGSASGDNTAPDCLEVSCKSMDSDISIASETPLLWWNTLPVSAQQQAVCFFFSNYVVEPSRPSLSGYDFLPAFYHNDSGNTALSCAVTALGLAGLSYRRNESCLLSAAKSQYSSALHLTNEALRDPMTATNDATLISVLLLGLYENNTCSAVPSLRSWVKHINGAAALLELRGSGQLSTEIGRTLFANVRTQIVNCCILARKPLPPAVLELSGVCPHTYECYQTDPVTQMMAINARICSFRAMIGPPPWGSSSMSTEAIISQALSIATDLDDWYSDLPLRNLPTSTVKIYSPTPDVYSDYYHIYSDVPTATLMNNYRAVLILVHEIIYNHLSYILHPIPGGLDEQNACSRTSSPSYIDQLKRQTKASQKSILDLIDLICASVPFHLDYGYCAGPTTTSSDDLHPRAAGGNAIMWPLYVAAQIPFVRNITRAWIIGRLNTIGSEMGVHQATVMARHLLQRKEVTNVFEDGNDADDQDVIIDER